MIIKSIPISLLNSLINATKHIGVRKTKKILEKASQSEASVISDYVISECCRLFQLPREDFFNNTTKGRRFTTNAVAAYVLFFKQNLSREDIIYILKKRSPGVVTKYIKYIRKLCPELKFEKEILDKIKIIEDKTDQYIKELLNN
jgi:hypothetical protein